MKIIERWKKSLYRKAVKHRLIAPQVIVLMDGLFSDAPISAG